MIEEGQLEEARAEIEKMEEELAGERSAARRAGLLRTISGLREAYASKRMQDALHARGVHAEERAYSTSDLLAAVDTISREPLNDKLVLTGLENQAIGPQKCKEARIEHCRASKIGTLEVAGSAVVADCSDIDISIVAEQIRLVRSHNIRLRMHSRTGAYLEDSSDVYLLPLPTESPSFPAHMLAYDMTHPGSTANFTFARDSKL